METNREIKCIRSQLEKAEHISELVELRIPKRAVVLQLAPRSEGSIVNKSEPLVTLVPLDVPLEAEYLSHAQFEHEYYRKLKLIA